MQESCHCAICGLTASKTPVWNKLDSRIQCPRCKVFDIDHRAEVNLSNGQRPPNWAVLSGLTRERWEHSKRTELPRLIWIEVDGDRDGKYIIEGESTERVSSQVKAEKLFQYLARTTDFTAGEPIRLTLPNDLSLAFARSPDELTAILESLQERNFIKFQRLDVNDIHVSLTLLGTDSASSGWTNLKSDSPRLVPLDVVITGEQKDSGAFGVVYPGRQTNLDRSVAIKIIQPIAKPDAIDHAKGLARVNHPNVVTVYDVGTVIDPVSGERVDCVVMEWLDGKKIFEIWEEFDKSKALQLCQQIIDGISAIHDTGICHHDLHAGNVMVCGDIVKIIDVQYTESARLSHLKTQSKELLLRDDCRAVARLFRNIFWYVDKDLLPSMEEFFQEANNVDDLCRLLTELRRRSELPDEENVGFPDFDGLTQTDLEVLRLAGDQVVNNDRFPGRISVPKIIEKAIDPDSVFGAIRLLTELGYFSPPRSEFPRDLMITFYGFDKYLQGFRSDYASEYRRVCIAIIQEERTRDIDIAAITEIRRPIVENVINALTRNKLIASTRYNSETDVHSVSERLKREFGGERKSN